MLAISQDPPEEYRSWWEDVIRRMERCDGLEVLLSALDYAESAMDPKRDDVGLLRKPGAYVAAQCRQRLADHNDRLPVAPGKGGRVNA